ncbi:acyl-CoA thioesterase [Paenibacillus cisolokensis]|jgi:Acyl-CoA hydrolase|uniref:Acyl-CoA thioester hydrolase YkhA n=1 Tax=Paenibacillus cisolokensis TaxID=1658519 RepID=A0ABQ4N512_9BACL|nr:MULTISPECIES: acyl-CoA thioesterase [Paenibacillus]ALS27978.1 acyl-CoA hydrolase [Paenibacillus sp. 32O-W]GIQ63031.1 putative acyl-CoA thioester hydrolase YkhA [Paenibacillus cisolokensis]
MSDRQGRLIRESRTVMTQLIFPSDTNHHGTMFGGKLMELMDKAAAIASMRHARMATVTVSTDSLEFVAPIRLGEVIEVEAFISWTHRSSMEVYVKVQSENVESGERKTAVTAFFTFVALGKDGKPTPVPPVIPESEEEIRLHQTAPERYEMRLQRRQNKRSHT